MVWLSLGGFGLLGLFFWGMEMTKAGTIALCACGCEQKTNARFVTRYSGGRKKDGSRRIWRQWKVPKYIHNHHWKGVKRSKETRAKMSTYHQNRPEEHQRKIDEGQAARDYSEMAEVNQRTWTGRKHTDETKQKQSDSKKLNWEDPNYREPQARAIIQGSTNMPRPNKMEQKLGRFLDNRFPGDWKYVGDGSVILGRKNPDFINVNGRKLIIELFGDYWHEGEDPADRSRAFEPYGFRTLVIWQSEMKNLLAVGSKIREFIET